MLPPYFDMQYEDLMIYLFKTKILFAEHFLNNQIILKGKYMTTTTYQTSKLIMWLPTLERLTRSVWKPPSKRLGENEGHSENDFSLSHSSFIMSS